MSNSLAYLSQSYQGTEKDFEGLLEDFRKSKINCHLLVSENSLHGSVLKKELYSVGAKVVMNIKRFETYISANLEANEEGKAEAGRIESIVQMHLGAGERQA